MPDRNVDGDLINRREFLKRAGLIAGGVAVAGAAGLGAVGINKAINGRKELLASLSSKDFFNEIGVGAFYPLFQAANEFRRVYGTDIPYCDSIDMNTAYDPIFILRELNGWRKEDLGEGMLERIRDGWGTKKDTLLDQALKNIQDMKIIFEEGLPNTPEQIEQVKKAYLLYAKVFPYQAAIATHRLMVSKGGGGYNGGRVNRGVKNEDAYMRLVSPLVNQEQFFVQAMHEHSHGEQSKWDVGKPYIDKERYVEFLRVKTDTIGEVMNAYFSLDWDKARVFKYGQPLINESRWDIEEIKKRESTAFVTFGYQRPDDTMNQVERYNRLIHAFGKYYLFEIKRAHLDSSLDALKEVAFELDHFFAGPVQKKDCGLPPSVLEITEPDSVLTKANLKIQMARIKTFSTLNKDELKDADSSFKALRAHFGLPANC